MALSVKLVGVRRHPFDPLGETGLSATAVAGDTLSIAMRAVPVGPGLPALSTEPYVTRWSPCVAIETGVPPYESHEPPPMRYDVPATPEPGAGSVAVKVKSTNDRLNQPFEPFGDAGSVASDVVGPAVSIANVVEDVVAGAESLPTTSCAWTCTVYAPSWGSGSGRPHDVLVAPGERSVAST